MDAKKCLFEDFIIHETNDNAISGLKWLMGLQRFFFDSKSESEGFSHSESNHYIRKVIGVHTMKSKVRMACAELCSSWEGREDAEDSEGEAMDDTEFEQDEVKAKIALFHNLGWIRLYKEDFLRAIYDVIQKHVEDVCSGEFEESMLPELQEWLQETMLPFVKLIYYEPQNAEYGKEYVTVESLTAVLEDGEYQDHADRSLWPKLANSLLRSFSMLRAVELFDIIRDFPDSMPAVKELRDAVAGTNTLGAVGKAFRPVLARRLLHVGAATSQILDMYVSMIRVLRVIDNSDILLNYVAAPVRAYLLTRNDTVRSVVQTLRDESGGELKMELKKGGSLEYGPDEDDEDNGAGQNWQPRKKHLDLQVGEGEGTGKGLDILALLVSIYGSTDLFVRDYRTVLADKLVANLEYRADKEVATLELLKIRFGEEALHACEVMLKDLEDSRRLCNAIALEMAEKDKRNGYETERNLDKSNYVDCLVISEYYWPSLPYSDRDFPLHPAVASQMERYLGTYADVKKPRTLRLVPYIGMVEIDLDFNDGSTRHFQCTPLQATLMLHVADGGAHGNGNLVQQLQQPCPGTITLKYLAQLVELEEEEQEVSSQMNFWLTRGVVVANNSGIDVVYSVNEVQAERAALEEKKRLRNISTENREHENGGGSGEDSEDEDADLSNVAEEGAILQSASLAMAAAADKAALELYKKYVLNIVTSHGTMTLDRLHTMLKLLASGGSASNEKFDMTILQLKRFLQTMVEADLLEVEDGSYSLHK